VREASYEESKRTYFANNKRIEDIERKGLNV